MIRPILNFEAKSFFIRKNYIIFFTFFILLAALSWEGISNYKTVLENQESFQEIERAKVRQFLQYTQYGARGVRLLFIPNPLSIIFNDLEVYSGLTANVDSAEGLYIYNSFKGKDLFSGSGGYMDFSGIILLIGCFLALIYGYNITKNREYLKLLADISGNKNVTIFMLLSRIFLFNLALAILSSLSLLWFLINGINVINIFFLWFFLYLFLTVTLFLSAGALIGGLKRKPTQLTALAIVYFSFLFFLPWFIQKIVHVEASQNIEANYKLEHEKLKVMMDFERKFYKRFQVWKSGKSEASDDIKSMIQSGQEIEYKKLKEYENKRLDDLSRRVKTYQTISAILPGCSFIAVNRELSSKGFKNLISFYRHAHRMKYDFIKFYIEKKFYNPLPKTGVEPFIKGDENLFYAKSRLPDNFVLGLFLNVFYISLLFIINYRTHYKRFKTGEYKKPQIDFKEGQNCFFVLCKDNQIKNEIFRYYEQQNAICLDKINTKDFRFYGISLEYMFNYFCRISGVNKEIASENLALLGITDLKRESHERDTILKIYAAIKIADDSEIIVLNDFLKRESRKLEENVFELLKNLEMAGKKIIYLSTEMYYTKVSLDRKIKVENTVTLPLLMDKITVR